VVENGDGIGACKRHGIQPDAILTSERAKVIALDTGLEWLRKNNGGMWAGWDDDDYYGPGYLTEVAETLSNNDIAGKPSFFVRRSDEKIWLFNRPNGYPFGHSFAAWSNCQDFSPYLQWQDDDNVWFASMLRSGARFGRMSQWHLVWQRPRGWHLYNASDRQLASFVMHFGGKDGSITDYGKLSTYDAIDRLIDLPKGKIVSAPEFDWLRDLPCVPRDFADTWKMLEKTIEVEHGSA